MKVLSVLIVCASAIKAPGDFYPVEGGIKDKTLMDKNGPHWRKAWPEGAIDNGDNDAETITEYNKPTGRPRADPPKTYPTWYEYEPHSLTMNNENQGMYSSVKGFD